ncbi:hypothetical protein I4U23_003785 [Adineta vaga]|nr:hypothetical protein I4U23_003785 [Adineta vaga]
MKQVVLEADWTTGGIAGKICSNLSLITVMPNGEAVGFYTNWIIPERLAPQNWRTYHMKQLVPWIDFKLRTITKKQGRAIGGDSMSGFGTIHYAELYPNGWFAQSTTTHVGLLRDIV